MKTLVELKLRISLFKADYESNAKTLREDFPELSFEISGATVTISDPFTSREQIVLKDELTIKATL